MSSTGTAFEMAETLIVLAGDNAWAAARAFGSDYAKRGKPEDARHWRDIARGVLRRISGALAEPSVLDAKPAIDSDSVAKPASSSLIPFAVPATAPALRVAPGTTLAAPIPMRAKRQIALFAVQAEDQPEFAFAAAA